MRSKKKYSRIIAGTMTWGDWGKCFTSKEINKRIDACMQMGITTFDHADIYGDYTNEADFGNALEENSIKRENIQLISKCGIQMVNAERNTNVKHYNYTKEYIISSVEQSLRNLKTDYLDMFLLHRPSPLMQAEIVTDAVSQLIEQGKICDFGVSNFTASQIALLETMVPVKGNQVEFSLTESKAMYDGSLDDCLVDKRMAMSWSPLGSFFRNDDAQVVRIRAVIKPMAIKYNATEDQLLLAWVLKHPASVYPVVGTTSEKRLKLSIEATKIEMELEDWFMLLEASTGTEVA